MSTRTISIKTIFIAFDANDRAALVRAAATVASAARNGGIVHVTERYTDLLRALSLYAQVDTQCAADAGTILASLRF